MGQPFSDGRQIQDRPDVTKDCDSWRPQIAWRTHRLQVAMGDGSVRKVDVGITYNTWLSAHTPNGKDYPGSDW